MTLLWQCNRCPNIVEAGDPLPLSPPQGWVFTALGEYCSPDCEETSARSHAVDVAIDEARDFRDDLISDEVF